MTVVTASSTGWIIGIVLGVVVIAVAAAIVITIVLLARRIAAQAETAERAVEVHPAGCPAHESVKDAITVTWDADIRDL